MRPLVDANGHLRWSEAHSQGSEIAELLMVSFQERPASCNTAANGSNLKSQYASCLAHQDTSKLHPSMYDTVTFD